MEANRNAQKISAAVVISAPHGAQLEPARPRRKLIALATLVAALLVGIAGVQAAEAFDDRFHTPRDVTRALRLPVHHDIHQRGIILGVACRSVKRPLGARPQPIRNGVRMSHSSVEGPILERNVPELSPRLPPRLAAGSRLHGLEPGELVKLHHSLAESLDCAHGVIAQFVAPEPDAAIGSVVYDLAYVSAAWLDKRVLFVNGTGMRFDMKEHSVARRQEPVLAQEFDIGDIESSITRVVGLELYQMTVSRACAGRLEPGTRPASHARVSRSAARHV